jgi:hypothetical protein
VQQNSQASVRVGGWLPQQAGEADPPGADWALTQETMSLPAFLTGNAAPPAPAAAKSRVEDPDKLPASERNMLIFVALLLLTGTIAIVSMAMFG